MIKSGPEGLDVVKNKMNERGGGISAFHAERECRLKYSISGKK